MLTCRRNSSPVKMQEQDIYATEGEENFGVWTRKKDRKPERKQQLS